MSGGNSVGHQRARCRPDLHPERADADAAGAATRFRQPQHRCPADHARAAGLRLHAVRLHVPLIEKEEIPIEITVLSSYVEDRSRLCFLGSVQRRGHRGGQRVRRLARRPGKREVAVSRIRTESDYPASLRRGSPSLKTRTCAPSPPPAERAVRDRRGGRLRRGRGARRRPDGSGKRGILSRRHRRRGNPSGRTRRGYRRL